MNYPLKPLKHLALLSVSNVDKKSEEDKIPVRLVNYTDVYYGDRLTPDLPLMEATASRSQVQAFQLSPGDVAITKDSETAEDIGIPAFVADASPDMVLGYHLALLRPATRSVVPRYLYWAIASSRVRGQLSAGATGVTRFGLRTEVIASAAVPSPPLGKQRAIADFLDNETARIDGLITKKRRMIDLLEELVTATLIHQALQGWEAERTAPLKRVARPVLADGKAGAEIVTAYRDGSVTTRSSRRADGYTLGEEDAALRQVRQGQLVFHGLDGFAGAVGIADMDGKCSPAYHVCDVLSPHSAAFFAFQLRALALTGYLEVQSSTVRQRAVDLRNWDRFGSVQVVIPSAERQLSAVRAITTARDRARRLVARMNQQLTLLQERRQALITAAVTGKLEVPGVAA